MKIKMLAATALLTLITAQAIAAAPTGGGSAPSTPFFAAPPPSAAPSPSTASPPSAPTMGNANPTAPIGGTTPLFSSTTPTTGLNNTTQAGTNQMGTPLTPGIHSFPCNTASGPPGSLGAEGIVSSNTGSNINPDTTTSTGSLNSLQPSSGFMSNTNTGTGTGTATPSTTPCQ
jgi:hypothetical protein